VENKNIKWILLRDVFDSSVFLSQNSTLTGMGHHPNSNTDVQSKNNVSFNNLHFGAGKNDLQFEAGRFSMKKSKI
jgi:hypothetical protein